MIAKGKDMITERIEAQEQAWKEYIAYRRRNSRMTLEEAAEIARELGVDEEAEEEENPPDRTT